MGFFFKTAIASEMSNESFLCAIWSSFPLPSFLGLNIRFHNNNIMYLVFIVLLSNLNGFTTVSHICMDCVSSFSYVNCYVTKPVSAVVSISRFHQIPPVCVPDDRYAVAESDAQPLLLSNGSVDFSGRANNLQNYSQDFMAHTSVSLFISHSQPDSHLCKARFPVRRGHTQVATA